MRGTLCFGAAQVAGAVGRQLRLYPLYTKEKKMTDSKTKGPRLKAWQQQPRQRAAAGEPDALIARARPCSVRALPPPGLPLRPCTLPSLPHMPVTYIQQHAAAAAAAAAARQRPPRGRPGHSTMFETFKRRCMAGGAPLAAATSAAADGGRRRA